MRAYDLIKKKRDGGVLAPKELRFLALGATDGTVADEQLAAFLMAVFFRGLDVARELPAFLEAMLRSGRVVDLSAISGRKVDKHSTGGVGDKISLPLAPLVAACGVRVPMVSGRGLGHTGGTLDKLESIPGFRVDLPLSRFVELVGKVGACLIGQTEEIAPADRKLYALRDATATVESIPLIASSILSKKLAEGIDALVLDVKVGRGAFMKTPVEAQEGDPRCVEDPRRLPQPRMRCEVRAERSGFLASLDAEEVGLAAVELGAGRARKEDRVDPAAGLLLRKRRGDQVRAGETLAQLAGASDSRLAAGARPPPARGDQRGRPPARPRRPA